MNFKTINDLNNLIKKNLYKIGGNYDLIVAVPRSGFLPATILSLYLNIPLTDLDNFLQGNIYSLGKTKKKNWIQNLDEAKKILIVEDSSASGNSINEVKEKLKYSKYREKCNILAIYVTNETKNLPDMYFEICELPRRFEWNYIHHELSTNCFDIDGVLCEDPKPEENDDGENYINFIKNAKPKFIPTFEIGCIITSRLEKYRKDTEIWLKRNNIKYKKLIMLDVATKEERVKMGSHGMFKGEQYKKLKDMDLFIESEISQAREIARISGKAVFCTDNSEFIEDGFKMKSKLKTKNIIKKLIPYKLRLKLKRIILRIKK